MQFLRTLFWVVLAVLVTFFAYGNWHDVTLNLWGDLQLDIKLPLLLVGIALASFLPPYLILRARLWTLRRRLDSFERLRTAGAPSAPTPASSDETPSI